MSGQKEKRRPTKPFPSIRKVIDEEFMTIGDDSGKVWTPEELESHHRIGDLIAEKLALGYTAEQINTQWAGKSTQEILAANGTTPHTAPKENREVEISSRAKAGVEKSA